MKSNLGNVLLVITEFLYLSIIHKFYKLKKKFILIIN